MSWYYAEGGKQVGPVEEAVLDDLVRQGVVRDETLVWREGMAAWQRHSAVRGSSNPTPAAPPPPPVSVPASIGADTRYCSECGRAVPAGQLTSFGEMAVCGQCKPAYDQRLGSTPRHFGGFWMRFLAVLIDAIILWVVTAIIRFPADASRAGVGLGIGLSIRLVWRLARNLKAIRTRFVIQPWCLTCGLFHTAARVRPLGKWLWVSKLRGRMEDLYRWASPPVGISPSI